MNLPVIDSGAACNNRCVVCPRPNVASEGAFRPLPVDQAASELPGNASEPLWVHGGEPTLHPDFEALLARARAAGRPVLVDTNARAFAVGDRAARAARAGLSVSVVTLYGSREASHDFVTGVSGSFKQTIAGATRLRAAGVKVVVRLLVSRSAVNELGAMATMALGLGASEVRFAWARMDVGPDGPLPFVRGQTFVQGKPDGSLSVHPQPAGDESRYDRALEWPVPRYGLALDALNAAVATVVRLKRPVSLEGVPACLAPAGASVAGRARSCATPWNSTGDFAAPCDGCTLRPRCPGVPSGYLARFGFGELVPTPASTTTAATGS